MERRSDRIRLFLADDSDFVRQRLKERLLEIEGIQIVGEAANVVDASRIINAQKPDVLILDLRMPGGNTLALLKSLQTQPHVPVTIIYTSFSYPQYRDAYLSAGADHFFDKTKDTDQLIELIQNLSQARSSPK